MACRVGLTVENVMSASEVCSCLFFFMQTAEDGKAHNITTPLCRVVEERAGDGSLHESSPGSELPCLGSERDYVPSQTGDPDSVVVTDELAATRAMRGQPAKSKHRQ